ncbi:MAG: hypothetical protein PQJ59_01030 [Spirochaetales bacterium]|nr:hypothetical protein [Spirochaetales bacterium]
MNMKKITALAAITLVLFFSCDNPTNSTTSNEPTAISLGEVGELTISVPLISSVLQDTLESSGTTDRAYLFAKRVITTLKDSNGVEVNSSTSSLPGGSLDDPGAELSVEMDVPWGLDYTVEVQILDDSEEANIIVEGESAPFDMGFDQVSLSLALLPANPTVLTAEGSTTGTLASSVYGTDSFSAMGDEIWYSLSPSSTELSVLTVETEGEALLFQADSDGYFQQSVEEHDSSQPTVLTVDTAAGETFYTGMIILDDSSVETDYTLTYQSVTEGVLLVDLSGLTDEAGADLILEISSAGTTAATLETTVADRVLYLFEEDGLNLWEGAGSYDYTILLDRDNSGEASQNDMVASGTLNMSDGVNTLTPAMDDFSSYSPDVTGAWYMLYDESDVDSSYKVMEIISLIEDDGSYAVYGRRHEDLADDYWSYMDEDEFQPLLSGTWTLDGYDMSVSIDLIDICTMGLLGENIDESYYPLLNAAGFLGLQDEEGVQAIMDSDYNIISSSYSDAIVLYMIFYTYTGTLLEESASYGDGTGSVRLLGIDSEDYRIKNTSLATDQTGDEDFRDFTADNMPSEVAEYLF